jgi:hypothetical protein
MSNKKIITLIISIALFSAVEMISCTHTPQTPQVSFSKDIIPILTTSCTIGSACHMGANSTNLETNFDSDSAYYTITKKGLISTGNPSSSLLYVEVRTNEMPLQPYAPLPASQQTLILEWIEQGAQNN